MLRLVQSLAKANLLRRLPDRNLDDLDGHCSVESIEHDGMVAKIAFRCDFDSVEEANVFLRNVAVSLGHPLVPPLPDETTLHHRAVVSTSAGLVGVDLDLAPSGEGVTASVTLTRGRRILLYAHDARPGGGMADAADLKSAAP